MPTRTPFKHTPENLNGFIPQKTTCPKCHNKTERILESRPSGTSRRRRYACDHCQTRRTSWELCDEEYQQLVSDQKKLHTIAQTIYKSNGVTPKQIETLTKTCDQCHYYRPHNMRGDNCDFGFPEAGGTFAAECSSFTLQP